MQIVGAANTVLTGNMGGREYSFFKAMWMTLPGQRPAAVGLP